MKKIYIITFLLIAVLFIAANYALPVIDSYMNDGSGYKVRKTNK